MQKPVQKKKLPPSPVELSKVLLVEGDSPFHFVEAFLQHLGIDREIEIWNFGGIRQLKLFVKNLASTTEFKEKVKSLGIVRDAEDILTRLIWT